MLVRLGRVLYWAGCILALVPVGAFIVVALSPGSDAEIWLVVYGGSAVGVWLIGRAAKYILAGE